MSRRVLVTGARGFVGSHAVPHLRARGFEIHLLGRHAPSNAQAPFHPVDLFDRLELARIVRDIRPSHLLHLAWNAEPGRFWAAPDNLDWVGASLNLLRSFAESGGVRAVFAGTCAEYQWGAEEAFDERQSALVPATLYGVSKDALRRIASAYAETTSLSFAWGRLFFPYGPGEKRGRLIADAICSLCSGVPFPTTEGWQRRDFIHVDDAARALAALLASEVCGAVNIGSGEAVSVRSVLETIAQETGRADLIQFGARAPAPHDPPLIEAAVARLGREVGFVPRQSLTEGLRQSVQWWRKAIGAQQ